MKKDLKRVIEIPGGVECKIEDNEVFMKSGEKETRKTFDLKKIKLDIKDNQIIISSKNATRRQSKIMGTIWAHLNNMIKGFNEDFVYNLEICNAHFPMNVKVEGDKIIIKSFLGETTERKAKILGGVKVDITGNIIEVSSHDIERAGQTAANIEKATRLRNRDRRIFQDGIFITKKCGREI